jgi:transcription initiation factor TFIID subunit 1
MITCYCLGSLIPLPFPHSNFIDFCHVSSKEIANFHRPRALWHPHVNQIAAQFQKDVINQGPMKVILMTLSGKGVKLQIYAEESLSSLKSKASKKLGFFFR